MNPEITLDQTVQLPGGFSLRPGTLDDIQICFELFNTDSLHTTGAVDCNDPNLILNDWKDPKFDMSKSTRLAFDASGKLAGYIEVWDTNNPPVHPWIWASIHPDYYASTLPDARKSLPQAGFVIHDQNMTLSRHLSSSSTGSHTLKMAPPSG